MDHSISTSRFIRKYQETDLDALLECWESAFRLAMTFIEEDFIAKVRADIPALYIPNAETWVFEENGRVVGFISLMGNEIAALFVDPKFHSRGIGRALIRKAKDLRQGPITVEVFERNDIGRRFYDAYGFEYSDQYIFEEVGEIVLKLILNEKP